MYNFECPANSVPYIIRKGDTLALIAKQYNSSVQEILTINPNIDATNLIIGQQICIPLTKQLYPTCPTTNYYVVQKDDTFQSIADYFNVTFEQLLYSNYGIDPNDLYIDQVLCIPVAPLNIKIIVNVAKKELNLYKNNTIVKSYSILEEDPNHPIPRGNFILLNKQLDPGVDYGARWLVLSKPGFGIHGINTPGFIAKLATDNNIILSNENISDLFNRVPVGTVVEVLS